jgi:hypothetical protein
MSLQKFARLLSINICVGCAVILLADHIVGMCSPNYWRICLPATLPEPLYAHSGLAFSSARSNSLFNSVQSVIPNIRV